MRRARKWADRFKSGTVPDLPVSVVYESAAPSGGGKSETVSDLPIDVKALYTLAAPSTPDVVVEAVTVAAEGIVAIGRNLAEVRGRLPHGSWLRWLEAEFGWSEQTARNFMNVAERFKSTTVGDLVIDVGALYVLSAPSTPEAARVEAIERAAARSFKSGNLTDLPIDSRRRARLPAPRSPRKG